MLAKIEATLVSHDMEHIRCDLYGRFRFDLSEHNYYD